MDNALELLTTEKTIPRRAVPRLKLLLEWEPAHKVFLSNLADAVSLQPPPPLAITSPPAEFWRDVFVPTQLPWKSFQESMLWHLVVFLAAWGLSQGWASRPQPHTSQTFRASGSIYYTPSRAFPAAHSSPSKIRPDRPTRTQAAAHTPKPMPVAAEHRSSPKLVVPPDLKAAVGATVPSLASTPAMPSVPLSATSPTRQVPGGLAGVVAPPPGVGGQSGRLSGLPQSAVVAPPADVAGLNGGRSLAGPAAGVVAPPPTIKGSGRGLGTLGGGNSRVVAPPPQLAGQGVRSGPGMGSTMMAANGSVVPPPPSVEHSGRPGAVSGPGSAVVPPPPSIQGSGGIGGVGRSNSAAGMGSAVVPPPPSVQNGGGVLGTIASWFSSGTPKVVPPPPGVSGPGLNGEGGGANGGRAIGSLGGGGNGVVPPPPSVQGGGTGTGRISSLGSGGTAVVPPPPSMQGAGGTGARNGTGNMLAGGGQQVVPPPPSLSGTGSGSGPGGGNGGRGHLLSAGGAEVVPPPPSVGGGGAGNGSGTGRGLQASLGGGQVVPPPPSASGAGGGNGGRGGTLMAGGTGVVAPPPSVEGMGNGGAGNGGGPPGGDLRAVAPGNGGGSVSTGPLEQMDPLDAPTTQPAAAPPSQEDLSVSLIQIPRAALRSSFFQNYEAIIAVRSIGGNRTEYIKLVYTSLSYQKRLSEYDWNKTKIYKLRAIQDPACDESLMDMMWPEGSGEMDAENQAAADNLVARVGDKSMKLRCYRTTADDFARAVERGR